MVKSAERFYKALFHNVFQRLPTDLHHVTIRKGIAGQIRLHGVTEKLCAVGRKGS